MAKVMHIDLNLLHHMKYPLSYSVVGLISKDELRMQDLHMLIVQTHTFAYTYCTGSFKLRMYVYLRLGGYYYVALRNCNGTYNDTCNYIVVQVFMYFMVKFNTFYQSTELSVRIQGL